MKGIPPNILNKYSPAKQEWLLTSRGYDFYSKFLMVKGTHCLIIGNTGAGKTQKGIWLVTWLCELETIVWIDAGKNNEIIPLFYLGKQVRVICPEGTTVEFPGLPAELQPLIIPVTYPRTVWDAVKKGCINIFVFRNTISDESKKAKWMSDIFTALSMRTRLNEMPDIFPLSIFADEAQWIVTSHRIKSNESRTKAAESITENALEIRGSQGRLILLTQGFRNITVASRENMPAVIIGRRAEISSSDSKVLAERSAYCGRYKPHQGLFVFPDGDINPWNCPWSFPYYAMPDGVTVRYIGFWDEQPRETDNSELMPAMSKYTMHPREKVIHISRFEDLPVTVDQDQDQDQDRDQQNEFIKKWGDQIAS